MDIKGDLSGIAMPGSDNPKITDRAGKIGITWHPMGKTCLIPTLSEKKKAPACAPPSVNSVLFCSAESWVLRNTQGGVVAVVFKYCDDNNLPLLDLKISKKVLQYLGNEGKEAIEAEFGQFSSATAGMTICARWWNSNNKAPSVFRRGLVRDDLAVWTKTAAA